MTGKRNSKDNSRSLRDDNKRTSNGKSNVNGKSWLVEFIHSHHSAVKPREEGEPGLWWLA
jgi:hypothetical protein